MRSPTATATPERAPRERARPLLGTIVVIRASDAGDADARAALDAAFAEIALIHRLMSFQEEASELSRANRDGLHRRVPLDPRTRACLAAALDHARASGGAFDPVAAGGSWRHVDLDDDGVRFARPLAIDLSGIAKGFAVDRACAVLMDAGMRSGLVNAGGDLRAFGPVDEEVALRPILAAEPAVIALVNGALASSDTGFAREQHGRSMHRDGRDGSAARDGFVSVAAPCCADADALTKVVLALGDAAGPALARCEASAWRHDAAGWRTVAAMEPA